MISIDEVHAAEEEWTQAHLKTDAEVLERLMHPDFTIIKPDGTVWKKGKRLRMVSDQSTEIP
ncbi:nuclear transport factor 2 family protein [Candidatus Bathyarchaeota archaeon]|nr:MAG: nuclear transport factor 2 family protein [Candidatus Bathyarchaeota archaeon]